MTATTTPASTAPDQDATTPADYRMSTGLLLSLRRWQLRRIADAALDTLAYAHRVYAGLTRAQTVVAAQWRLDDALFMLQRLGPAPRA